MLERNVNSLILLDENLNERHSDDEIQTVFANLVFQPNYVVVSGTMGKVIVCCKTDERVALLKEGFPCFMTSVLTQEVFYGLLNKGDFTGTRLTK